MFGAELPLPLPCGVCVSPGISRSLRARSLGLFGGLVNGLRGFFDVRGGNKHHCDIWQQKQTYPPSPSWINHNNMREILVSVKTTTHGPSLPLVFSPLLLHLPFFLPLCAHLKIILHFPAIMLLRMTKTLLLLLLLVCFSHQQCIATVASSCGIDLCVNFYWNGSKCLSCFTIQHTNTTAPNTQAASTACLCLLPFLWDPTTNTCLYACNLTDSWNCGQNYCNNYFWNGTTCVSCGLVPNAQSYALTAAGNVVCSCIDGYIWNGYALRCDGCSSFVTTQELCGAGVCGNFFWNGSNCLDCQSLPNTLPYITTAASNTRCLCQPGYIWTNSQCSTCRTASAAVCGSIVCNNYFWNGSACLSCNDIEKSVRYRYTFGVNSNCACVGPAVWSARSLACFSTCDAATAASCGTDCLDYYWNGTKCLPCSGVPQSDPKTSPNDGSSCKCLTNFLWSNNACVTSATCLNGTTWDSSLLKCVCKPTEILLKQNCFTCLTNSNQTGKKTDDTHCECVSAAFYFKISAGRCVCQENAIWLGGTCVSCRDEGMRALGVRANLTACLCAANMSWTAGNKCECSADAIAVGKGCWSCAGSPFALPTPLSATECACELPYTWSTKYNNCTCDSNSIVIVNDSGLYCYPCNSHNNATKIYTENYCQCQPNFSWSVADNRCICPTYRLYVPGTTSKCVNCKAIANALGKYLDWGCICKGDYIWNELTMSCSLCSAFPSATTKSSVSTCYCSGTLTWNQQLYKCA